MSSGGWVWHKDRQRSLERDPTWRRHYIPSRIPVHTGAFKHGKPERQKPPSKPKKVKPLLTRGRFGL